MKKILFIIPSLYNGGAEKSLVSLLQLFDTSRYEIDLLLFKKKGLFLKQVPSNVNVLDIPSELKGCYNYSPKESIRSIKMLKANIVRTVGTGVSKLKKKDRVQMEQYRWEHFYSKTVKALDKDYDVAAAYMEGEPIYFLVEKVKAKRKIGWIHNDYSKLKFDSNFDRKYFERLDKIVSISDKCVESLKLEFPDLTEKFCNIPNLTSSEAVKRMSREYYPEEFKNKTYNILSIGRLSQQKGFDLAIEACKILKNKGFDFNWHIIGSGELESELKVAIKKYSVEDKINIIGVRENPYAYIANCDLFVQTSRYEGKSVVIDEAKILGKPILVTKYPTVYDQIEDMVTGVIVNISAQDIAEGIEKCINNEQISEALIKNLASGNFTNEECIHMYYDIMEIGN